MIGYKNNCGNKSSHINSANIQKSAAISALSKYKWNKGANPNKYQINDRSSQLIQITSTRWYHIPLRRLDWMRAVFQWHDLTITGTSQYIQYHPKCLAKGRWFFYNRHFPISRVMASQNSLNRENYCTVVCVTFNVSIRDDYISTPTTKEIL